MVVGLNVPYAQGHRTGTRKMVARPAVRFSRQNEDELARAMAPFVQRQLRVWDTSLQSLVLTRTHKNGPAGEAAQPREAGSYPYGCLNLTFATGILGAAMRGARLTGA